VENEMAKETFLKKIVRRQPPKLKQNLTPFSSQKNKPRLLDLFCCAGGAGMGYSQAGFEVVGVDIAPQPNYPFAFIKADALKLDSDFVSSFDAIHASPPCQSYSVLAKRNGNSHEWPRLIEPVRAMLQNSGLPYVIENVVGSTLHNPVLLCGTMFPNLRVLRHRLFEANFLILTPKHGKHPLVHTFDKRKSHYGKTDEWVDFVMVTGGGNCTVAAARDAMGIDWMSKNEINESIPPAYTQFIGEQLLRCIFGKDIEKSRFGVSQNAQTKLKRKNKAVFTFKSGQSCNLFANKQSQRQKCY
jgi:DNA (cytosine-5)-methyltransferase 1